MEETKTENKQSNSETKKEKKSFNFGEWHDKYYKLLLLIPIILMLVFLVYEINFYKQNGDFIKKDISLTGGTSVTINEQLDENEIKAALSDKLEDIETRVIYDIVAGEQKAIIIETRTDGAATKKILEEYLGYELNDENSSIEFTGSTLSENFYRQLLFAVLISFVLMSIVIFVIFRDFVPSAAVVISAFADIFMALVTINILGIEISSAGIVAFLMLIGYSVDTDILLTNRVLKGNESSINEKIYGSFKTGVTMTLIAIISVLSALFVIRAFSSTLSQIFTIILVGLFFDLINTWVTNVSILKWHVINKNN